MATVPLTMIFEGVKYDGTNAQEFDDYFTAYTAARLAAGQDPAPYNGLTVSTDDDGVLHATWGIYGDLFTLAEGDWVLRMEPSGLQQRTAAEFPLWFRDPSS
jgi:hypothetical protein